MTSEKPFSKEFFKFLDMLKNEQHFSLNRWGDGELMLIENKPINLLSKGNGEFDNIPDNILYNRSRQLLKEAFLYQASNYYVGIACRCCVGDADHENLKKLSGQDDDHLTYANIFVNSNYNLFITHMVEQLKSMKVVLISHRDSIIDNFPISLVKHYKVPPNAWLYANVTIELKKYIADNDIQNHIFLFAAGPYSNIATYELHKFNQNNSYIDVGSVFDGMLGLKVTRRYLRGGDTLEKTCIW